MCSLTRSRSRTGMEPRAPSRPSRAHVPANRAGPATRARNGTSVSRRVIVPSKSNAASEPVMRVLGVLGAVVGSERLARVGDVGGEPVQRPGHGFLVLPVASEQGRVGGAGAGGGPVVGL